MQLSNLLTYDKIVIQCHNNPDPDSIASGFALHSYLKSKNKDSLFFYSGDYEISKPNLIKMIDKLNIPIHHVRKLSFVPDILITVDCQYGESNVTSFKTKDYMILDHHVGKHKTSKLIDIRSFLGSCATLVWTLLKTEGFNFKDYPEVSTALYYGLLTDTNNFNEIMHPLDKDMQDSLYYDIDLIKQLKNSNLSLVDLETAGIALLRCFHNKEHSFAVFKSHPCDPNILGFISDLAIQVNIINTCVVYNEINSGIKFSVRSCSDGVKANEVATFLTGTLGSGGGHFDKAGGFISYSSYNSKYKHIGIDSYFQDKLLEYFETFYVQNFDLDKIDLSEFTLYEESTPNIFFVKTTDLFEEGSEVNLRTLSCDLHLTCSEDLYLCIDINDKVSTMTKNLFYTRFNISDGYELPPLQYNPSVRNIHTGEVKHLKSFAKGCTSIYPMKTYAKQLTKNTKILTPNASTNYISGLAGDYLVIFSQGDKDVQIIKKDIFESSYKSE